MEDGPPSFPQGFTCPAVLGNRTREPISCCLQDCHLLWWDFPDPSTKKSVSHSPARVHSSHARPRNTVGTTHARLHTDGLGCFPFARRYWGNRNCFLFLQVLRWFTSLGLLYSPYEFRGESPGIIREGLPHSETSGSEPAWRLTGAFRCLQRPSSPLCA